MTLAPGLLLLGCVDTDSAADPALRAREGLVITDVAAEASDWFTLRYETQGEPCVADFDGDGDLDLLPTAHHWADWQFLENVGGGHYEPGITLPFADRHGCAAADVNGDGRLDMYTLIGARLGTTDVYGVDELWIQGEEPLHFDNSIKAYNLVDGAGRGRSVTFLDSNGDAFPDLFVGNEIGIDYPSPSRHYLGGATAFTEDESSGLHAEVGAYCVAPGDLDGDGLEDLVVCGTEATFIYRQAPAGVYTDISVDLGLHDLVLSDAELMDMDEDGSLDLVTLAEQSFTVRLNRGGTFPTPDFRLPVDPGRDLAITDTDGDGHLDVYLVMGTHEAVNQPDIFLFGDGSGVRFKEWPLPYLDKDGEGDVATPLPDWKGTGRPAILVSNGKWERTGYYRIWQFDLPE